MFFQKPDHVREPLFVLVPLQNPWRWRSRWKHTERAIKHFMDSGAVVVLIETAFNRRELAFENSGLHDTPVNCDVLTNGHGYRHMYIGLHSPHELWLKEAMINVGRSRLPYKAEQIAWCDSDVHFLRPNWVGETIHKLQHYDFIQMFSHAADLGPNYEMLPETYPHANGESFMKAYQDGHELTGEEYPYPPSVWPGLAWAARCSSLDHVGGLFDIAIWGGGDYDMAHALVEQASKRVHKGVHPNYKLMLTEYEDRCRRHIRRNVGVMEGTIVHHWHGKKTDRKYREKRKLMNKVAFDPQRHLKRDSQGLWQMHDDGSENYVHFRDMMRKIAKERNEDSTDV